MPRISIKPFQPEDQDIVKELVLAGLVEHWGKLDPNLNPDLDDISKSYNDAVFLVAWISNEIVGTGAIIADTKSDSVDIGEVVRMSVAKDKRRLGIGKKILAKLISEAKNIGLQKLILETTSTWTEVIKFYKANGFYITHEEDGEFGTDTYFELILK